MGRQHIYAMDMSKERLKQIESEIEQIKKLLQEIGEMRPGSLTKQYRDPENRKGAYYQVSYTHKMKSHTDYVRSACVKDVRTQIATYKRFKKFVEKWIELAIEHSKTRMRSTGRDTAGRQRTG
jgi:hypothetical protein